MRSFSLVGCIHAGFTAVLAKDCSVGGSSLCGCSELISRGLIDSFDDCSQSAAVAACESGACVTDVTASSGTGNSTALMALPYRFHDDNGPFDLAWGFPTSDTIEIEFSLPSTFYIGMGFDEHGTGDTIAGWLDSEGQLFVGDFWDAGSREPESDESRGCRNDVEAVAGSVEGYGTKIRFRRKLDTGDKGDCDAVIGKGPMFINYAYCDAPWCASAQNSCNGFKEGCIDVPHGPGAWNVVQVDFFSQVQATADVAV